MQKKEFLEAEMRGWQDGSEQEWDLNLDPQHPFKSLGHACLCNLNSWRAEIGRSRGTLAASLTKTGSPRFSKTTHLFHFQNRVSRSLGWPITCYVVKDDLKLLILLPVSPECWDYKYPAPCLVCAVPGIKPRVLLTLDKYSSKWVTPPSQRLYLKIRWSQPLALYILHPGSGTKVLVTKNLSEKT